MSAEEVPTSGPAANAWDGGALNMMEELPDLFERFFASSGPATPKAWPLRESGDRANQDRGHERVRHLTLRPVCAGCATRTR